MDNNNIFVFLDFAVVKANTLAILKLVGQDAGRSFGRFNTHYSIVIRPCGILGQLRWVVVPGNHEDAIYVTL